MAVRNRQPPRKGAVKDGPLESAGFTCRWPLIGLKSALQRAKVPDERPATPAPAKLGKGRPRALSAPQFAAGSLLFGVLVFLAGVPCSEACPAAPGASLTHR